MGLDELQVADSAVIEAIHTDAAMRRRLQDLGFAGQTTVTCVGKAPSGDPIAFGVRGAVIALRREDCRRIRVRRV